MHFTDELDPGATLAAVESVVHQRRSLDLDELQLALRWADLHSTDPQTEPGAVPVTYGGDHLVSYGGPGTPLVQDLCAAELAIAAHLHPAAARRLIADALDLRHRLPRCWAKFLTHGCPGWVLRKIATMTRHLSEQAAALVDAALAEAITTESPGRLLRITEAKIIEADTAAHAAGLARKRRARHASFSASDEHGLRYLIAHLEAGDAAFLDAVIDRLADLLHERRDLIPDLPTDATKDELRATALGWLARPEDAYALLTGTYPHPAPDTNPAPEPDTGATTGPQHPHHPTQPSHRRDAVTYLHLHQAALTGTTTGIARVEGLGPLLLEQLRELLAHTHVTLTPVIDLNDQTSVNSYEHPEAIKQRTHLRNTGEVFPHAVSQTRHTDTDHPTPYTPHGPPAQTGDHNAAPLTRHTYRAKTHKGYHLTQLGPAEYLWRTPHGLCRLVNTYGTHDLTDSEAWLLQHPHAWDDIDQLADKIRASQLKQ